MKAWWGIKIEGRTEILKRKELRESSWLDKHPSLKGTSGPFRLQSQLAQKRLHTLKITGRPNFPQLDHNGGQGSCPYVATASLQAMSSLSKGQGIFPLHRILNSSGMFPQIIEELLNHRIHEFWLIVASKGLKFLKNLFIQTVLLPGVSLPTQRDLSLGG